MSSSSTSAAQTTPSVGHAASIPPAPRSFKDRIRWLGPGVTWMAAGAGGAGELLFPPRMGSLYGYAFVWALVAVIILKWAINREVGRFSVCTGAPLLEGFSQIKGPRNWAVWLIVVPQLVVAVSSIAGLAGSAATACRLVFSGNLYVWVCVVIGVTTTFLLLGKYAGLEKAAMLMACLLALAAIAAAVYVFPPAGKLAEGMVPSIPENTDFQEVVPWLSFVLAGAAGMIWYSYWIPEKGYGAARLKGQSEEPVRVKDLSEQDQQQLRGWLKEMTLDNTLGVIGGFVIVSSFLILGAELLQPKKLLPEEDKVAQVLADMLTGIWGRIGFWIMAIGVLVGFVSTTLTNQDGWARLLAGGTRLIGKSLGVTGRWSQPGFLRKLYLIVVLAVAPAGMYMLVQEPVGLLQLAGVIEALHIPVIVGLTVYLNRTLLPPLLRPSLLSVCVTGLSVVFFLGFAGVYLYQLFTQS